MNTITRITRRSTLIDDPVFPLYATGVVDHIHDADMPGELSQLVLTIPGGGISLDIPMDLELGYNVVPGATVDIIYHVKGDQNILDSIDVTIPVPAPVPDPDDPIDPVPTPQQVEGLVNMVTYPEMPGEPLRFTVGMDFEVVLTMPDHMALDPGVVPGALVHVDFHAENGVNLVDAILLLTPAPNPTPDDDDPIPGPIDDPEDEPLDETVDS